MTDRFLREVERMHLLDRTGFYLAPSSGRPNAKLRAARHARTTGHPRAEATRSNRDGCVMLIRRINARSSASICGRPPEGLDFQRQ
jgi:hypothetical protein